MACSRRGFLAASAAGIAAAWGRRAGAAAGPVLRLGLLRYGTAEWELEIIRRRHLDGAAGIAIEPHVFAGAEAAQIALQAGGVDVILLDWLWVARQRASGADWTAVPISAALGAVIAPKGTPIHGVADLAGRHLGIAGTALDKSWLLLRAYAAKRFGLDLDRKAVKNFGPPPLLQHALGAGQLDAVLTYWPFAARGQADGMTVVLTMDDVLRGLGFSTPVPFVSFVFSERWAARNRALVEGFLSAAAGARQVLARDESAWQDIQPLTGGANPAELGALRDWYRRGLAPPWTGDGAAEAAALYRVLADIGGPALIGQATTIPPGTFWPVSV
jgi:NitT/TauT family transport system substrate-binding protein